MENCIKFENLLFGDNAEYRDLEINDFEFVAERLVSLPTMRPFSIENVIIFIQPLCKNPEFGEIVLEKSSVICPVLTYRLFKLGIFQYKDIVKLYEKEDVYMLYYYFWRENNDLEKLISCKTKPYEFDDSFFFNDYDIDDLIMNGFVSSSTEYCLKYDDINNFMIKFDHYDPNLTENVKWSPFEWSKKPDNLSLLCLSAYFGSIRCFKHLILLGYRIDDFSRVYSINSGSSDIFHMCNSELIDLSKHLIISAQYCRLSLLEYLIDNGGNINARSLNISNNIPIGVFYILLQIMDIFQ